jgi:hypothetical protein
MIPRTPGPWRVMKQGALPYREISDADGLRQIAEVHGNARDANARLIAAAPDLLKALAGMLVEWEKFTRYGSPIARDANENVRLAKAAIERATAVSP